jgi:NAD-dependent deacetylase
MTDPENAHIAALRDMVEGAERIVALTGAGISTESGIPDFRSPGGIWSRIKPITYQDFRSSEEARLEDWRRRFNMREDFARAEPNAGHFALAPNGARGPLRQGHHAEYRRACISGRDCRRNC